MLKEVMEEKVMRVRAGNKLRKLLGGGTHPFYVAFGSISVARPGGGDRGNITADGTERVGQ